MVFCRVQRCEGQGIAENSFLSLLNQKFAGSLTLIWGISNHFAWKVCASCKASCVLQEEVLCSDVLKKINLSDQKAFQDLQRVVAFTKMWSRLGSGVRQAA